MTTAPNPGPKTLEGTHTYVVGVRPSFLIDPGPEHPEYGKSLGNWLREGGHSVQAILLTHGHPDHAPGALGLREMLDTEIWASERMPREEAARLGVDRSLRDGDSFAVDGDVLQVAETPGHAFDHVAFWLAGARILFAGDTILGRGTSLIAPPEGDMGQYMDTLERLRRLHPRLIAPGHGPIVTDPPSTLDSYVRHRQERETAILEALGSGPATVDELVRRVYTDVDPRLHGLASGSVQAQLAKLVQEGRVRSENGTFSRA